MSLTQEQINEVQAKVLERVSKEEMMKMRNNFGETYDLMKAKTLLSSWTMDDVNEMVSSFKNSCSYVTYNTCKVVREEFRKFEPQADHKQCCVPCFFVDACQIMASDRWHRNMVKVWKHLKQLNEVTESDKQTVTEYINNMESLQGFNNALEAINNV